MYYCFSVFLTITIFILVKANITKSIILVFVIPTPVPQTDFTFRVENEEIERSFENDQNIVIHNS